MTADEKTLTVLIIDGDTVRRGMLACTLPASRYSLEFARSSESGLDLLGKMQPDVVVVGHDSVDRDICQRIRSHRAGSDCALLLMDEQFRDETVGQNAAQAAGADSFLPFPFEYMLFEQKLKGTNTADFFAVDVSATTDEAPQVTQEDAIVEADDAIEHEEEDEEQAWSRFRDKVASIHGRLESTDYYQLLNIAQDATNTEIKSAYFACAMDYHPDRFLQLLDEELKTQIYEIYKRMSEAFKILIDPDTRSRYDAGLKGTERNKNLRFLERPKDIIEAKDPTADAKTPAAKKHVHYANLAEDEGNLRSARMYLSLALQCEPHNQELRTRLDDITRRLGSG